MTIETAIRPPVAELQPAIDTMPTNLTPREKIILTSLNENGGRIQRSVLLQNLFPEGNTARTAGERAIHTLRRKLKPFGKTVKYGGAKNPEYEIVEIGEIELPNGNHITIEGRKQRDALSLLVSRAESGISTIDLYGNNGSKREAGLEWLVIELRKQISEHNYSILGHKEEGMTTRYFLHENNPEKAEDKLFEDHKVTLPNGTIIGIRGGKQREVLQLLIAQLNADITARDAYPKGENDGKNYERSEGNLFRIVKELRKKIPKDYIITAKTDEEGITHYRFIEDASKTTLPNGKVVEGLTQHEHAVLSYFANENLPIYMKTLTDNFYPGIDYSVARSRIRVRIQDLKKALSPHNAELRLATKFHTPNSAYYLAINNMGKKNSAPFLEISDTEIKQRINKITGLLEAQNTDKSLTLTDEVNDKLNSELYKLKEEEALRRLIEERKKAKIEEWKRKQNKSREKGLVEQVPENEYDPIVRFTRIRYLFSNKGLPNKVLDEAGQEALEKAKENFNPENGFSFEEYADFWIRGAMGNMLLYNSPEAPETEYHGLALPDESITSFKKDFAIALVDLSSRRRYPENFITPYESRALDIMRGITGKNPGSSEDVAYEFDSSIQWAERLGKTGMEKLQNSLHAPTLAKYFSS